MTTFKAKAFGLFAASAFLLGSLVPVAAVPLVVAPAAAAQAGSLVIDVQSRIVPQGQYRDQPPIYRGHRGSRERRPGYRQHNGFWFPMAAFTAGAIIGGAAQQNTQRPRGMSNHVAWCESRYRSYRASDNTYNPGNGRRAQCVSPR
jgi:hypothetical protein